MNAAAPQRFVQLVECPRDAYQGLPQRIPVGVKVKHLNALVEAGFRRIDFGSFVSPQAVPQMSDTVAVWEGLQHDRGVEWIAIIVNERGAGDAAVRRVPVAGFPLSVNETFQVRNTNKDFAATWPMLERISQDLGASQTELVVYLSMAFGNPYGEPHDAARVVEFAKRVGELGVFRISLADTVGAAQPEQIEPVFTAVRDALPRATIGLHLHQRPDRWPAVVDAALRAGCRRFDAALGGIGGCPFADDELVGNLPSEGLIPYLHDAGYNPSELGGVDLSPLVESARRLAAIGQGS
ncbi:MAG: hydroxymethylglutaryl-CoA lyase [Planctomycetota bacterium]